MPDLNKQSLINLLIDSPLREPIKINLIDIVNNTADADLAKVYPTITKELEIFEKATDRRLKLAAETIAKLTATPPATAPTTAATLPAPNLPTLPPTPTPPSLPPLPPLPPTPSVPQPATVSEPLSVPPLDLPPLPQAPLAAEPAPSTTQETVSPPPATPPAEPSVKSDEAALAEIQKELDSLKVSATSDATPTPPPTPTT